MIKITPAAAAQIRLSADQSSSQHMALRIVARVDDDKSIVYGMGFDERQEDDVHAVCEGIEVLISPGSKELLTGAVLDYAEVTPGEFRFFFFNPNDPQHVAPTDGKGGGGADPAA